MIMINMYKATMYRMLMSKGCRVLTALTFTAAVLYYVLVWKLAHGEIGISHAGNITGLGDAMIIWLFGSLMIGILVGTDFENKTIHGIIGYGRGHVIIHYIGVYVTCMAILLLPYTIGSVWLIASGQDMQNASAAVISVYLGNVLDYSEHGSVWKLLLSYLGSFLVYVGQLSICIPIALKCRKAVVVTAFGFLLGMMTALLQTLASSAELFGKIYRLTPYDYGVAKIGLESTGSDLLQGILVSCIFTGLCTVVAYLIFRRADIK